MDPVAIPLTMNGSNAFSVVSSRLAEQPPGWRRPLARRRAGRPAWARFGDSKLRL